MAFSAKVSFSRIRLKIMAHRYSVSALFFNASYHTAIYGVLLKLNLLLGDAITFNQTTGTQRPSEAGLQGRMNEWERAQSAGQEQIIIAGCK